MTQLHQIIEDSLLGDSLIPHAATCARGGGPPDYRGQLVAGVDPDPVPLANGDLELRWSRDAADASDT